VGYKTVFAMSESDVREFRELLGVLKQNADRPHDFLQLAGEVLVRETMDAFRMERDPNTGRPWLPTEWTEKLSRTVKRALIAQIRKGKAGKYVREG
jgi:hypothetical protein